MFICSGCERHAADDRLRYTLLHHLRVDHPAVAMFVLRLCSRHCLEKYLQRLLRHADRYILTDNTGASPVQVGPESIAGLLDYVANPKSGAARTTA